MTTKIRKTITERRKTTTNRHNGTSIISKMTTMIQKRQRQTQNNYETDTKEYKEMKMSYRGQMRGLLHACIAQEPMYCVCLLVTPGTIPLDLTPRVPDSDQLNHLTSEIHLKM